MLATEPRSSDLPAHEQFRIDFRAWLAANVPTEPEPRDIQGCFEFRRAWQRCLSDHGWAGVAWPSAFGGRDATPLEQFVYYEELARARAPKTINEPGLMFFGPALMVHGSEEQKRTYLPRILSAEDIWCQGFSEPEAGSDLASLRTRAELDGNGTYHIEGHKIWTSFAAFADRCALLCRVLPDVPKHKGLGLLIMDMKQPGVQVRPIKQMNGEQEFGEVFIEGALADADRLVGDPGHGWTMAMTMLEFERSDVGLHDHGRYLERLTDLRAALDDLEATGAVEADAAADLRRRVDEVATRARLLRELNLAAAYHRTSGGAVGVWGSVTRLYWSDLGQAIGSLAMEIAGPDTDIEHPFAGDYLYSRSLTIASGSGAEIQRNLVGERILGLPR